MNPVSWLEHVPERYRVDRRELGKVLIVASTAILFMSIHSILVVQSAMKDVKTAQDSLKEADARMSSQAFNESLQAIKSLDTYDQVDIYNHFRQAGDAFTAARNTVDEVEAAADRLERNFHMYQWLVVISLLGEVAGIAVIYL